MVFRTSLILCVLMLSALAFAGTFDTQQAYLSPTGHVSGSLDNPEPDTLAYDAGTSNVYFSQLTNFWLYTRFTPPAAFRLRSIYLALTNQSGNTSPCSLFVYLPNGTAPGTLLVAGAITPQTGSFWYDCTLPDSVDFTEGQDFLIVMGRCVGPTGWTPLLENANGGRTYITNPNAPRTGPYSPVPVNARLRAGGSLATFVDMQAQQCFNLVNNTRPLFYMLPGASVLMKAQVKNLSSAAVDAYTVNWSVTDPNNANIFTNEVAGSSIAPNAIATVVAGQSFTVTTAGEYMARAVVVADGDAVSDNDTTYLRFFVGGYPRWYRYDDNGATSEGSTFMGTGNETGVSFRPAAYSAKIDTVRAFIAGDDATGQLRIYLNDNAGKPTGTAIWNSGNNGVTQGWNARAVTPPINIFLGQTFTVAYSYGASAGLGKDANAPNMSSITRMDTIAWQGAQGGWEGDEVGNWMIQAHLDSSNAVPTYAVIETSHDTLQFGPVDTTGNNAGHITLWVYNRGGGNPLHLTQMAFRPSSLPGIYTVTPNTATIAAGDSASFDAAFNPTRVQAYNGWLVITNDSQNDASDSLIVRGQGSPAAAADDPNGLLPTQFSLAQNYPNPFNPTTEIQFSLPVQSHVRLTVYDLLGQEVATLVNGSLPAGVHTAMFNAAKLPSGIYFYRLEAGSFSDIRKMMLMK